MGAAMFKALLGSMGTKGDEVFIKAGKGQLKDTKEKLGVTINTDNIDIPKTTDEILDDTQTVNRARQSDKSFDGRNFNLTNTTDGDELVRAMDWFGSQTDNFAASRGGSPQPHSETIDKAKKMSRKEFEKVIGYKLGDGVTPERIAGARIILQESADNLVTMAKQIQAGEADINFQLAFRQAISSHVGVQQAVAGMAADSGRALNAWRIPVGANMGKESSIYRSQLQSTVDKYGGSDVIDKLAEVILNDGADLTKLNKNLKKMHLVKKKDIAHEYWINGLLSSPATHVVNISSNAVVAGLAIPERFIAASIGSVTRNPDRVQFGEVWAQFFGIASGTRDGFKLAYKAIKDGEVSDPAQKYEAEHYNAFTANNINHAFGTKMKEGSGIAKGIDYMGEYVIRMPTRFLGAEDEFFKSVGYRMELNSLAYRTAKNEGLKGAEFVNRVKQLVEEPTEEIHLGAVEMSKYQTFTNDLGPQGKKFQKAINQSSTARIILPFVRTPTNILKYVAHRSPIAPFTKQMKDDWAAGGVRRHTAVARMAMGSSTLGVGYMYALEGKISGRGPYNKEAREALKLTGWQPYSVLRDGKWYSYNRADPIGMFLGLAADTAEVMKYADTQDGMEFAVAAISAVAKNVQNKSYLDGIANFINAFEDTERYGEAYFGRLISSFKPMTSLVGQVERTVDPTIRETYGILDKITASTPWFSEDLPPRRNIFGDVQVLQGGLGWDFVSPVYTSKVTNDPVAEEIVAQEVGISMPRKKYGQGTFEIDYTPEEYDRLVLLTGKLAIRGRNLHQSLEYLINSNGYNHPSATDGPDGSKAFMIRAVINEHKEAALKRLTLNPKEPLQSGLQARIEKMKRKKKEANPLLRL